MLERASTNGKEISREDFYNIMTKKSFWEHHILYIYIFLLNFLIYKFSSLMA